MTPDASANITWLSEYRAPGGGVEFRLGRSAAGVVAEWPGMCTLHASRDGSESRLVPASNVDPARVAKLRGSLANALLRHLQNKLTLHAGSASIDGRAIACFGESGSGKSTTMAEIARRPEGALLADDTTAIEWGASDRIEVIPTERVNWLLPESCAALDVAPGEAKRPVAPTHLAHAPCPLVAVVKLTFAPVSSIVVRRVRGQEALAQVLPSIIRFVIDEGPSQLREFEQLRLLTESVPFYEITRPASLDRLGEIGDRLVQLAREAKR